MLGGPIAFDAYQNTIALDRRLLKRLTGGNTGLLSGGALTPGSGLSLDVAPFEIALAGTSTNQGSYYAFSDEGENIPWPAASSQARWDALVFIMADGEWGTVIGNQGPKWQIVQGVPSGSPVKLDDATVAAAVADAGAWVRYANILVGASATVLTGGADIEALVPGSGDSAVATSSFVSDDGPRSISATSFSTWTGVPTITFEVPPSGKVEITWGGRISNVPDSNEYCYVGLKATGMNAITADNTKACLWGGVTSGTYSAPLNAMIMHRYTGLTPGATTFQLVAKKSGGTTPVLGRSFLKVAPI